MRSCVRVLVSLCVCALASAQTIHIRNFVKVNEHIYRGGEPTAVGMQELGAMGVKTVIDLRVASEATSQEKKSAQELKIKYINIPMGEFGAPSNAQMAEALNLLERDSETVFVHCRRGKDRTGTVIACYRVQHDGWDNHRALEEARERGMSSLERSMRSYILHFTPLKLEPQQGMDATTAAIVH